MARVLIVDDSPTELHVLRRLLEKHGHQILLAHDALQGIDLARRERPDLILMDVVMPGMSGFQATRKLSRDQETATIPVFMVTSKNQESDRIWGLRQGAVDYVLKPVQEHDIIPKMKAVLGS
ncbi:MAG: response regulator [Pseudomonadota bacterium]